MKILTAAQMRALDCHVIEELGISGLDLMEQAGRAVAEAARAMHARRDGEVLVLCGKGNNGGDGFVAARLLRDWEIPTRVVLPFPPEGLSGDAAVMLQRAREAGVPVQAEVSDAELAAAGIVIDALLGTGVTGPVHGVLGDLITRVNALRQGRGVLAVDLPSGVDADTGKVHGPAIRAERTVTMALPKPCLLLHPGAELAGAWEAADIGFPPEVIADWPAVAEALDDVTARAWLPRRAPTAHKRSVGWALIIAGSRGMTGAAVMACQAAYRGGAGLVRLALPNSLLPIVAPSVVEVVTRPMPETRAGALSFRALAPLCAEAAEVQATLIGPGLSRNGATQQALRRLIPALPGLLVVDADALTAMAGEDALWQQRTAPTIITPHPGEMARLLGRPVASLEEDRIGAAQEAARRFGVIAVYKGTPVVIAAPDGRTFLNPLSTSGLAVAGTGDVLAGLIVALLAQGVPALEAAVLACYIGGGAAQRIAEKIGVIGMTAPDLIEGIPDAIHRLHGSTGARA